MGNKFRKFRSHEWKKIRSQIWVHDSGTVFHGGLIRVMPEDVVLSTNSDPILARRLRQMEKIWGNKRRGMMALCVEIVEA